MLENIWHIGIITSIIMNYWKYTSISFLFSIIFDNMEAKEAIKKDNEAHKAI